MTRRGGFSLIELVLVIVIVAIASVGIGSAFSWTARSLAVNEDLQRAAQVARECAEHILWRARPPRGHYAAVAASDCNGMAVAGFSRVVNIAAITPPTPLCEAGWNCQRVQINVTKGSAVVEVNFMLVQY